MTASGRHEAHWRDEHTSYQGPACLAWVPQGGVAPAVCRSHAPFLPHLDVCLRSHAAVALSLRPPASADATVIRPDLLRNSQNVAESRWRIARKRYGLDRTGQSNRF